MITTETEQGLALICDPQGIVESVARDSFALGSRIGQSVIDLPDPVDSDKARQFLLALQTQSAAFDWEMAVHCEGALKSLHFAGSRVEGGFLVLGALSRRSLRGLTEELTELGRGVYFRAQDKREGDSELFDEQSRINNELTNLHRDLSQKNAELARLSDEKTRFLGVAAHELRSPLSVILSYSEFLDEESQLPPEQHEFVSVIKNTSGLLLRLIDDLLDVAQIDAGRLSLQLELTDLGALARNNLARNQVLAGKKQIRIRLFEEQSLPRLWVDPGKMEQVLNNLLGNAIKFSPPNTEICVRLGCEGSQVVLAVEDQGPGIPEPEQAKLFKPFSRLDVNRKRGESGVGLGLSIVRRIIEGHHGTISVKSAEAKGSSFQVRLPRSQAGPKCADYFP